MKSSQTEIINNLLANALKYCDREGIHETPLPELKVIRREKTTEASPGMYASVICLVLQGEKRVWSGKKIYRYDPENYLVSCIDIPATVQIVRASAKQPYVGLTLELEPSVVYDILQETSPAEVQNEQPGGGFFVEKVTAELGGAFARLMKTLENKNDLRVLAPSIVREIHYHLMSSRYGMKVRQLGVVGSKTQRIGKVVEHLRRDYAEPLSVTSLARMANMSPSSFHLHFRQVTSMSPLQYQKQVRLQEARRLLSVETTDVASVAFKVGYESPSQFSREYRRLFGQPPMRDMDQLRTLVTVQE